MDAAQQYDYAVIGGGAAGLSFICQLVDQGGLMDDKRLLLVDPEIKEGHDHTWSLWEKEAGPFDQLVYHSWSQLAVHDARHSLDLPLQDYRYKLIRSLEFYSYCNRLIADHPAIDRLQAKADAITPTDEGVSFKAAGKEYHAAWAFSSLADRLDFRRLSAPYLDQHFRGWFIKTTHAAFDPGVATIMDFRTEQDGETRFFYVLPFSTDDALVEMAIFSNQIWKKEQYDQALTEYLAEQWPNTGGYTVEHTEQGVIPMTTHPYPAADRRLIYIGIAGGHARASTGYTFYNIQRRVKDLAQQLATKGKISRPTPAWPTRHRMYDATLLRILQDGRLAGSDVFVDLFRKNPTERLLAFLNGESSFVQELQLMQTTPVLTFGTSFFKEILR